MGPALRTALSQPALLFLHACESFEVLAVYKDETKIMVHLL